MGGLAGQMAVRFSYFQDRGNSRHCFGLTDWMRQMKEGESQVWGSAFVETTADTSGFMEMEAVGARKMQEPSG
jgi:hypothetical protein